MGELLTKFETQLASIKVVPSEGGRFEISLDRELVYSKLATGEFPEERKMVDEIGKRLKKIA